MSSEIFLEANPGDLEQGIDMEFAQDNDTNEMETDAGAPSLPIFQPLSAKELNGKNCYRRVRIPPHRYTPLKNNWENIMRPMVEHMKIQVRFNPKTRSVEMKTSEH